MPDRLSAAPLVWIAGVGWDDMPGTDKRMAIALAESRPILWVDSSRRRVWNGWLRRQFPSVEVVHPGITRLRTPAPPGFSRWPVRYLTAFLHRLTLTRSLGNRDPAAVVIANPVTRFPRSIRAPRVFYVTDDWIAGASLIGHDEARLVATVRANLKIADAVAGVTPELVDVLRHNGLAPGVPAAVIPNGAPIVLRHPQRKRLPVAGVVGQLNERIDLTALQATLDAGVQLRVIGPRSETSPAFRRRLDAFLEQPGVDWTGPVSQEELAVHLAELRVGLTPYVDSIFNRSSFPLKTLEYLSAGVPVVSTDLSASHWLNSPDVVVAESPNAFAAAVVAALSADNPPESEAARMEFAHEHGWPQRAEALTQLIDSATEMRVRAATTRRP